MPWQDDFEASSSEAGFVFPSGDILSGWNSVSKPREETRLPPEDADGRAVKKKNWK